MVEFNAHAYGPVFAPLLAVDRRRPLDAGQPDSGAAAALKTLSVATAFADVQPADTDMAACCLAGVWLLHDHLEESHSISQGIDTTSGSFWHAILHRREGDYANTKYWFRHVGAHPVFDSLGEHAALAASPREAHSSLQESPARGWDPFAFVDMCQAAVRGTPDQLELCLDIQQAEWELLFDHCYREVVGSVIAAIK